MHQEAVRLHRMACHEAPVLASACWQSPSQAKTPVHQQSRPQPCGRLPVHNIGLEARRQSSHSCSASSHATNAEYPTQPATEYAPACEWITQPRSKRRVLRQLTRQMLRVGTALVGLLGTPGWQLSLAAMCFSPAMSKGSWQNLKSNHVFLVGFWAWLMAQTMKIFTKRYKKGIWDIKAIVDSGGMPSSHSSLCMAVTTAVALEYGLASPLFAMSLCFSLIVMYDATGVRRHAGKQAEVLNIVITEMLEGHPVRDVKLKEVLGHTPLQVLAGASLGILVGLIYPQPTLIAPI